MRTACLALSEAYEEPPWVGTRWRVGKRTFAHVVMIELGWPPAYARWAPNVVGMVLGPDVDWGEVTELVTESYCVLAPQRLVALVERPSD